MGLRVASTGSRKLRRGASIATPGRVPPPFFFNQDCAMLATDSSGSIPSSSTVNLSSASSSSKESKLPSRTPARSSLSKGLRWSAVSSLPRVCHWAYKHRRSFSVAMALSKGSCGTSADFLRFLKAIAAARRTRGSLSDSNGATDLKACSWEDSPRIRVD